MEKANRDVEIINNNSETALRKKEEMEKKLWGWDLGVWGSLRGANSSNIDR